MTPTRPRPAVSARRLGFAKLFAVALTLLAASCSGATEVCSANDPLCDAGTGTGPTFPTIAQSVLDQLCIRGEAVPNTSKTGSLTSADCPSAILLGYFEAWRVRVPSNASVTFQVTSNFDSLLEVYRVDSLADVATSAVLIAENDDFGSGIDARLTTLLAPNTEYLVLVLGWDEFEQGSYTLSVTS